MPEKLSQTFCAMTRKHLSAVMKQRKSEIDVQVGQIRLGIACIVASLPLNCVSLFALKPSNAACLLFADLLSSLANQQRWSCNAAPSSRYSGFS